MVFLVEIMTITSKKLIIPLITVLLSLVLVITFGDDFLASARRDSSEYNRTCYISDILRITEGVSPVLWIDPQYSYESKAKQSKAKYFDLSGNGNHGTQSNANYQPTVKPPGLDFDSTDDYVDCESDASVINLSISYGRTNII